MANLANYRAKYIISSIRANRRSDEYRVEFYTNRILEAGDSIELDGLTWYVDEVVYDIDR